MSTSAHLFVVMARRSIAAEAPRLGIFIAVIVGQAFLTFPRKQ